MEAVSAVERGVADKAADTSIPQLSTPTSVEVPTYRRRVENLALRIADGVVIGLPCALVIAVVAILAHPLRHWRDEAAVLLLGIVAGIGGGAGLGAFIGKSFVGGKWLTCKLRSVLLKCSVWFIVVGISGVFFHDWVLPISEKLDQKVQALREFNQNRINGAKSSSTAKRGIVELGAEINDQAAARYERAKTLDQQAKNENNTETKKALIKARDKEQADGDKLAKIGKKLANVPDDPTKIAQVVADITKGIKDQSSQTTVTQNDNSIPIVLKILAVELGFPELLGLDWGFGSTTVKKTIQQIYAGNPPSEDDLRRLLSELQNEQQRQIALTEIKQIVEAVVTDPNKKDAFAKAVADIQKEDWTDFAKKVLDSLQPGSTDQSMADALFDALRDRLPANGQDIPAFPTSALKAVFSEGVKSANPQHADAILTALNKRLEPSN